MAERFSSMSSLPSKRQNAVRQACEISSRDAIGWEHSGYGYGIYVGLGAEQGVFIGGDDQHMVWFLGPNGEQSEEPTIPCSICGAALSQQTGYFAEYQQGTLSAIYCHPSEKPGPFFSEPAGIYREPTTVQPDANTYTATVNGEHIETFHSHKEASQFIEALRADMDHAGWAVADVMPYVGFDASLQAPLSLLVRSYRVTVNHTAELDRRTAPLPVIAGGSGEDQSPATTSGLMHAHRCGRHDRADKPGCLLCEIDSDPTRCRFGRVHHDGTYSGPCGDPAAYTAIHRTSGEERPCCERCTDRARRRGWTLRPLPAPIAGGSAYVVDDDTINRVVTWLYYEAQGPDGGYLRRKIAEADASADPDTMCADLGNAMMLLNIESVRQRYDDRAEDLIPDEPYTYRSVRANKCQVLKSLDCWSYQSCEGTCDQSPLYKLMDGTVRRYLADQIIDELPEMKRATWS